MNKSMKMRARRIFMILIGVACVIWSTYWGFDFKDWILYMRVSYPELMLLWESIIEVYLNPYDTITEIKEEHVLCMNSNPLGEVTSTGNPSPSNPTTIGTSTPVGEGSSPGDLSTPVENTTSSSAPEEVEPAALEETTSPSVGNSGEPARSEETTEESSTAEESSSEENTGEPARSEEATEESSTAEEVEPAALEETTSPPEENSGEPARSEETTEGTSGQGISNTNPTPNEIFDIHAERIDRFLKSADAKAWDLPNLVRQEEIAAHNEEINSNLEKARQYIGGLESLLDARPEYREKWSDLQNLIGCADSIQDMAEEFNFELEAEEQARAAAGIPEEQAIIEKGARQEEAEKQANIEAMEELIELLESNGYKEEAKNAKWELIVYTMLEDAEQWWEENEERKAAEEAALDALLAAEKEGLDSLNDPAVVRALVEEQLSQLSINAQAESASEVDSEAKNSDSNSNNNSNSNNKNDNSYN